MSFDQEQLGRASLALPAMTSKSGIPKKSDICFSPRIAYSNAPFNPTLFKLAYVRVDSGGTGYSDGAIVYAGATEVGRVIVGNASVYGATGVIAAVRMTNNLGLTLTSAPALTVSGGTGAVLTAMLVDQEAARASFNADLIEWSYIGCNVDSGGTTDPSEQSFIDAWSVPYKMALTQNSKPKSSGVQIPPTGYGRPDVSAVVAFGGEIIDASNAQYGGGVGYASLSVPDNTTTKLMLCATTMARSQSKRLMHDDPGFQNQVINIGDFSAESISGFPAWLAANTTAQQRTSDGLDAAASILGGYDYKAVLVAWYTACGLSGPSTSATHNSNRRTIQSGANAGQSTPGYNLWRKYHRSTLRAYYQALKAQMGNDAVLAVNGFCSWPITPNFSVGGFFFNSALLDGVIDNADYVVTEWSSAAGTNATVPVSQLQAEFAIHANSVRLVGKMLTGPQVSLDPIWHNEQLRRTFLTQSVGYIYALGASCYPAWDGFIQLGNGLAWREFIPAAEYGGVWDFIAENKPLYEGFENCPAVVLVINGDALVRTTSGVWPRNQHLLDCVNNLLVAGVPFAFSIYSNLDSAHLRNAALESAACYRLSTCSTNAVLSSEFPANDNWGQPVSAAQLAYAGKYWVSRVVGKTGDVGDVIAIPRIKLSTQQITIHICNMQHNNDGSGVTESGLSLQVSDLLIGNNDYMATCYRPGSSPINLTVSRNSMNLPAIDERGAIVLLDLTAKPMIPALFL